ncbi:MAG: phasin [Pseudomonadota bacterium]
MAHDSDPFSFSPTSLTDFPESMRAFAEKGFAQARDGYQKLKEAAEANNGAIEAVYQSAARGASDYGTKLFEIAKTNTDEAFGFAQALLGSKSVTDAFELMNSHARKQFELLSTQSKDLVELGQRVATETVEPIKASAAKAFKTGL